MKQTYTAKERNMYLIGLAGQNMVYNIVAVGMAFYFQSVIFLPQLAISIIMAIARVWDAFNDPMMGTIVDRTRTKWGKCRPYLIFTPVIIGVATVLTFLNGFYSPQLPTIQKVLIVGWAGFSYILFGMCYTAGDIPIWGITALMTNDEKDREKLLALARIVAGIGGGVVMLLFVKVGQGLGAALQNGIDSPNAQNIAQSRGFIIAAILTTIVSTALFQCASYAKEHVKQPSDEKKKIKETFQIMWGCMPFRRLLISGVIRAPMQIIALVAMSILSYYYGDYDKQDYLLYMILLGGGVFGGQFITMALTPKLTTKYEKKKLYNFFTAVSSVPFAAIFVLYLIAGTELYKPVWLVIMFIMFLLVGGSMGAVNVLQSVMIADCIDYDEDRTGYRPDGVFFAGQSFITKLGAGISSLIQGAIFTVVGFSDRNIDLVNNYLAYAHEHGLGKFIFASTTKIVEFQGAQLNIPAYRLGMFLLISLPAAITCVLSILPTLKYELTNEKSAEILDRLNKKRAEKEQAKALKESEETEKIETTEEIENSEKTEKTEETEENKE